MMKRRLLPVLGAALLAVAPLAAQSEGVLSGTVVRAGSEAPVPDAILRIGGTDVSAVSDREGRFVLRGLPVGRHSLELRHGEFGEHTLAVAVSRAGEDFSVIIRLSSEGMSVEVVQAAPASEPAPSLAAAFPVTVTEAALAAPPSAPAGRAGSVVERGRILQLAGSAPNLGELIRRAFPSLYVRAFDGAAGDLLCLEFRGAQTRSMNASNASGTCNHPQVHLDGVSLIDPAAVYGMTAFDALQWIQAIPPAEAGARFGGAAYGVILVTTVTGARNATMTPGRSTNLLRPRATFDWSTDPQGHPFLRAMAGAAVGSTLGLLAAQQVWDNCVYVDARTQELERTCPRPQVAGVGTLAVVLPAVGSALGAHFGGRTTGSEGRWVPSLMGAAIALLPGYGFSLATVGSGAEATNMAGRIFLIVGTPVATALADRMYRHLR